MTAWTFTPDSKAVYAAAEEDGQVRVYRIDLAGGAPTLVLKDGSNGDVQVTPDGKTIVFSRASLTAPAEIYRANADGIGRRRPSRVSTQRSSRRSR